MEGLDLGDVKDMDDLFKKASDKGLYAVNHEDIGPLAKEYDEAVKEADRLLEIVDDDSKPYESKYKAREILDKILQKLEATRAIAGLERKKDQTQFCDMKVASARVKVGGISWEVDEPHNAQQELESACEYYFPELVNQIDTIVGPAVDEGQEGSVAPVNEKTDDLTPPPLNKLSVNLIQDAMLALNLLGILWAGRGQVRKSFLYLLSANTFYETNIADKLVASSTGPSLPPEVVTGIESTYTHNLFYLAQAYGNIGNTTMSSKYCRLTLQRQYGTGFSPESDLKTDLEWVKNCAGMADFFVAMRQYNYCALALTTAEKTLIEKVTPRLLVLPEGGTAQDLSRLSEEIQADINRRWVSLDAHILKRSSSMLKDAIAAAELGEDFDPTGYDANDKDDFIPESPLMPPPPPPSDAMDVDKQKTEAQTAAEFAPASNEDLAPTEFVTCVSVVPSKFLTRIIGTFDVARAVFLRAVTRLEAAKKFYVLDGYVTDHVKLLQEHSRLFHYLSVFDSEIKRKLAMEQRRLTMLTPLLITLSKSAYEALHKQISYELGECAITMLDLKLDKLRSKDPSNEIHESKLKKSEILNCNEYCKIGLAMFAHFTHMYNPQAQVVSSDGPGVAKEWKDFEKLEVHQLCKAACMKPDESTISEDEIRPFLNAHFLSCRLMSKVMATAQYCPNDDRTFFMAGCYHRYEYLTEYVPKLCRAKSVEIDAVFAEEYQISKDMTQLLPSKINRMRYSGESGLSL